MTNLFLKAKHWQLFLLLIGIPLGFQIFALIVSFANIKIGVDFFDLHPFMMIAFATLLFGWFYSITIGFQKYIPEEFKINRKRFNFFFFVPLIYIALLILYMSGWLNTLDIGAWIVAIILPLHLFSMVGIFHTMYCVAKTIKTLELKKKIGFGEFTGEFFLLWFYIVGIWFIQPKVNKLFKENNVSIASS